MIKNNTNAKTKRGTIRKPKRKSKESSPGNAMESVRKTDHGTPSSRTPQPSNQTSAKEVKRLNAIIAKLTGNGGAQPPKRLYFNDLELAARWGMSVKHVRAHRYAGTGPKFTMFGRNVRYRLRDIVAFEKANTFDSTSDRDVQKKLDQ